MKMIGSLAWKNLARYRRRTVITATALAVGLALYIFVDSMLLGLDQESQRNLEWYETGSAQIMDRDYFAQRDLLPLKHAIEEPERLLGELDRRGVPAAPRTTFQAELVVFQDPYPADGSFTTRVHAIDPARDPDVFHLPDTVSRGRFLRSDDSGVMLGSWLAEDLGAEVGYPITLVTRTRDGFYQTIDAEVVGIVAVPNPAVNRRGVFMPLEAANDYLQMQGAVTEIVLSYPLADDAEERTEELERELLGDGSPQTAVSWKELAPEYVALSEQKSAGSGIILFLVFIIAAVGVSNTMLMAVYERVREIGMMRAMGMADRDIRRLFLAEAGGIGLIGAALGVGLGAILVSFMVNVGIDYSAMVRDFDIGYRVAGVVRSAWNVQTLVSAAIIGVLLTVAVAWIPTRRAIRMRITDALRHQ